MTYSIYFSVVADVTVGDGHYSSSKGLTGWGGGSGWIGGSWFCHDKINLIPQSGCVIFRRNTPPPYLPLYFAGSSS